MNGQSSTQRMSVGQPGPMFGMRAERAWILSTLLALSAVWVVLGLTWLKVGPYRIDDCVYLTIGAKGELSTAVPNRYVHIWALRLLSDVLGWRYEAAVWYGIAVQLGLVWSTYVVGRALTTPLMGVVAAGLVPLTAPLLTQFTVPMPDPATTMWSCAALAAAVVAGMASGRKGPTALAWLACGLFVFCAIKTKETGVAVVPAVAFLWYSQPRRAMAIVWGASGFVVGWLLLSICDAVYGGDFWFSWRLSSYQKHGGSWLRSVLSLPQAEAAVKGKARWRMDANLVTAALKPELLPVVLTGVAAIVGQARDRLLSRALAVWCLTGVVFMSLMFWRYHGVHADSRYLPAMIVPLAILCTGWAHEVWRTAQTSTQPSKLWTWLLLCAMTAVPVWAHFAGSPQNKSMTRADFFLLPIALILLALAPNLANGKWLRRVTACSLLILLAVLNAEEGVVALRDAQQRTAPFVTVAGFVDSLPADEIWVASRFDPRTHRAGPFARRVAAFSRRPIEQLPISSKWKRIRPSRNYLMFAPPDKAHEFESSTWRRVVQGKYGRREFVTFYRQRRQRR